jgi:hypothetical protein
VILAESSPFPAHALWFTTMAVEAVLLVRTVRTRLFLIYPVFCSYLLFVLSQSLVRFAVYHWRSEWYLKCYWYTEFIGVLVGCGLLFEIYWKGLAPYPGTARVARNLLALVMVFTAGKVVIAAMRGHLWWPARTTTELERNLRTVQGVAILALVILLLAYSIPLRRNLRGVVLGYGLFLAAQLVSLAALPFLGAQLNRVWAFSQQGIYLVVLFIWAVSLWTPSPQPGLGVGPYQAPGYEEIERKTRERFKRARVFFRKK